MTTTTTGTIAWQTMTTEEQKAAVETILQTNDGKLVSMLAMNVYDALMTLKRTVRDYKATAANLKQEADRMLELTTDDTVYSPWGYDAKGAYNDVVAAMTKVRDGWQLLNLALEDAAAKAAVA